MKIIEIDIAKLNPAVYNPRKDLKPGDPEYEHLKRSILEWDYIDPVIWNQRTGNVVGGHQRLKVLQELGRKTIQVSVVDLDPPQEKALNIALNKIAGDWDNEKLAALIQDLRADDLDISLLGFDADELDRIKKDPLIDISGTISDNQCYELIIFNLTENQQVDLLERLNMEGYQCKAFIS